MWLGLAGLILSLSLSLSPLPSPSPSGLILIGLLANSIEITWHPSREQPTRDYASSESPQPSAQQSRELRSLSPSEGFAAAAQASSERRAALQFEDRRQVVRGLIAERDSSRSPSLRRGAVGREVVYREGGVSGLIQEEWDEEVVNEGPGRDLEQSRRLVQHSERLRREEDMMSSSSWAGPAFTGIGLRDHMPRVEEMFITNAAKLGRVPQAGESRETEFVVLDITKKTLFLQSCVHAVVNRLRRSELVGAANMRMEVQAGEVTPLNPRQMVGWAAATWAECVIGLFRFYPDEVVAATVVPEARCLLQLWYLPHKEFVTAFYNKCLATWSQKPEEFTELTRMQQFVRDVKCMAWRGIDR